jgi:hypothetical protein
MSISWFNGDYRKSRKIVLVDRQKAMLAATMLLVEREKMKRDQEKQIAVWEMEIREHRDQIQNLRKLVNRTRYPNNPMNENPNNENPDAQNEEKDRNYAQYRCSWDECRGFISTKNKTCPVCDRQTCLRCLSRKEDNHECNPDEVATAKDIKEKTVSCPGCQARIHKISGCDQMFCVLCHVAFSYKTGEIAKGAIHNPHYHELRTRLHGTTARAPGDIPCGGFPRPANWHVVASSAQIMEHGRRVAMCTHIAEVEIRALTVRDNDACSDIRLRYVMGDITEEFFASLVSKRSVDAIIKQHYRDIMRAYTDTSQDVYRRMDDFIQEATKEAVKNKKTAYKWNDGPYLSELNEIIKYTNEAAQKIGKQYKRTYFQLPTDYQSVGIWNRYNPYNLKWTNGKEKKQKKQSPQDATATDTATR